jgi:hypothetical protein
MHRHRTGGYLAREVIAIDVVTNDDKSPSISRSAALRASLMRTSTPRQQATGLPGGAMQSDRYSELSA